MQSIKMFK